MNLGEVIKKFRYENNMTMEEFAKRTELSKGYISMLEKNSNPKTKREITPSYTTIMRIAKVMSIDVDVLFSLLDDNQPIKWNSPREANIRLSKKEEKLIPEVCPTPEDLRVPPTPLVDDVEPTLSAKFFLPRTKQIFKQYSVFQTGFKVFEPSL